MQTVYRLYAYASALKQLGLKPQNSFQVLSNNCRCFKVCKATQSQMAISYRHDSVVHLGDHHNVSTQLNSMFKGLPLPRTLVKKGLNIEKFMKLNIEVVFVRSKVSCFPL